MGSRSRRSREVNAEINITAFMNLMVVLVPFLLITAVFSQISILELNLPAGADQTPEEPNKKPIVLEVLIYKDRLEVVDRQTGPLKIINNQSTTDPKNPIKSYRFAELRSTLLNIKGKFPDITDVTILLEDDTPYDLLIKTMDTVRIYTEKQAGNLVQYELFPDIAIGNAPPDNAPSDKVNAQTTSPAIVMEVES